jgi:hypothetical protein
MCQALMLPDTVRHGSSAFGMRLDVLMWDTKNLHLPKLEYGCRKLPT